MKTYHSLLQSRILFYVSLLLAMVKGTFFSAYIIGGILNIGLFLLFLLLMADGLILRDRKSIWSVSLCLPFLLANLVFREAGLGSVLNMSIFLLYYLTTPYYRLQQIDFRIVKYSVLIFLLFYASIGHENYNYNSIALTFLIYGIIFSTFLDVHTISGLFLFGLVVICVLQYLIIYDCRTDMGALLLYVLFRFLPVKILGNKVFIFFCIFALTIGGLGYAYLYVSMYNGELDTTFFNDLSHSVSTQKKLFSGREVIWDALIKGLHEHPWLGTGSTTRFTFLGMDRTLNVHHSMLTLFAIFGFPVGVMSTYIMYRVIMPTREYLCIPMVKACLAAYFSFLLVGFSETIIQSDPFLPLLPLILAYGCINAKTAKSE